MERINALLDRLPRTRVGRAHRPAPAFRTCGITGFYLALLALFGGGLLAGRSPVVLAALALVSGLSFFAYTYLRKWITGREELVLLEHVWFALACNAAALRAMQEPMLAYLDVVAVALCPFLASGRVGCTLVGCCHGLPSSFGIRYTEECAADGFPRHLVGIRLFPAPALEGIGLALIGVTGLAALPFAADGKVFLWFLLAYAVMRFGLEGIRGDRRPYFLGLSQAQWMAVAEAVVALGLSGITTAPALAVMTALMLTLVGALATRNRRDRRRVLLTPEHARELRDLARSILTEPRETGQFPQSRSTSRGVIVSASPRESALPGGAHVSLSLDREPADLPLLCSIAARAFPELIPKSGHWTGGRVLHVIVPAPWPDRTWDAQEQENAARLAEWVFAAALRRFQAPAFEDDAVPRESRRWANSVHQEPRPSAQAPAAAPILPPPPWCLRDRKEP